MAGIFYGIGVGPGDPELLTLKAINALGRVEVIFAAASDKNDYSLAAEIAGRYFSPSAQLEVLYFPMSKEAAELEAAWLANACQVEKTLSRDQNAAFVTLGDPLIYSTFGYLHRTLKKRNPALKVEIIPGITSFQAAAAKSGRILCEADQSLLLLPGTDLPPSAEQALSLADNAVILKAYKNMPELKRLLKADTQQRKTTFVSRLGLPGEDIVHNLAEVSDTPPYLSLLLLLRDE